MNEEEIKKIYENARSASARRTLRILGFSSALKLSVVAFTFVFSLLSFVFVLIGKEEVLLEGNRLVSGLNYFKFLINLLVLLFMLLGINRIKSFDIYFHSAYSFLIFSILVSSSAFLVNVYFAKLRLLSLILEVLEIMIAFVVLKEIITGTNGLLKRKEFYAVAEIGDKIWKQKVLAFWLTLLGTVFAFFMQQYIWRSAAFGLAVVGALIELRIAWKLIRYYRLSVKSV